ncbi:AaceriAEL264Cp [[Ashbya] aceris (nom. inval.)]|nr:AaceriAEL264Cp [[Ashbya] aceris (nom. inval.)]
MNTLPDHVLHLLKTSKYVHLATASSDGIPSVSLMNYAYLSPESPVTEGETHYIVFATSAVTEKYQNITSNPNVSLLIHDWVTAKKLSLRKNSTSASPMEGTEADNQEAPSRLLNILQELNQSELSQMSATLRGLAEVIDSTSPDFLSYRDALLKANPDAKCFILGDDVVMVKVHITSAKVSDTSNNTSVYH